MALRFKFFCLILFFTASSSIFAASEIRTDQNSEALEMVGNRMRSLSKSLEGMPAPPAFKQEIQLPTAWLTGSQNSKESELSQKETET